MTWEEAKANSDKLVAAINKVLLENPPKDISDIIKAVHKVDEECGVIPNPNYKGVYGQLLLYPSSKWNTWGQTSMLISEYNIYR